MLMGFPVDFWVAEHIQSVIASFGIVIHWEEDHANLARRLVKARVTNLEEVPRHKVFLKLKDSWGSFGPYSVRSYTST
jgi:hypothetical protein